jgi:hypothetical protein
MTFRPTIFVSVALISTVVGCTTTTHRIVEEAAPAEATPEDDAYSEDADTGEADGEGEGAASADASAPRPKPKPAAKAPADGGAGGPDGGALPGVDRTACVGTASSSGSIYATTPAVKQGVVITDPSGALRLVLLPNAASLTTGDITIGLYFTPIPGQLDYSPNGSVGCAVLRYTGSGWAVVDKTQLCELHFSVLDHATAPGVCDGTIAGTYNGLFSGNQPLAGTFVLPSDVAASQIKAPSCRPYDSICSKHSDCCSQSCSPVLGLCQ